MGTATGGGLHAAATAFRRHHLRYRSDPTFEPVPGDCRPRQAAAHLGVRGPPGDVDL